MGGDAFLFPLLCHQETSLTEAIYVIEGPLMTPNKCMHINALHAHKCFAGVFHTLGLHIETGAGPFKVDDYSPPGRNENRHDVNHPFWYE